MVKKNAKNHTRGIIGRPKWEADDCDVYGTWMHISFVFFVGEGGKKVLHRKSALFRFLFLSLLHDCENAQYPKNNEMSLMLMMVLMMLREPVTESCGIFILRLSSRCSSIVRG